MPFSTVKLTGGVNAELTPVLNQAGIAASNLIRFKGGLPQKLGGWQRFYPTAVGGAVRDMHAWEDLEAMIHLAAAGDNLLKIITGGVLNDITPELSSINAAPNFSTTAGSTTVVANYPSSYVGIGDAIVFETPVSVGGTILNGTYQVYNALGPDAFSIQAATPATSTVTNAGVVPVFTAVSQSSLITAYFPNHGYSVGSTFAAIASTTVGGIKVQGFFTVATVPDANHFTFQTAGIATYSDTEPMNGGNMLMVDWLSPSINNLISGFGINGYGMGGYGAGSRLTFGGGKLTASDWSLDNWGELLLACAKGGPIFQWGPSRGYLFGQVIPQAPIASGGIFVAMPEQILVAWGASVIGLQDPLLVCWCDVGDFTTWTAAVDNQAGSFRIPRGSALIGGMQGPQQALLWTDLAIWSMQYVGYPGVFGFNELASGCGLIAQHAAGTVLTAVFWMSQKGFFVLAGGAVQPVECPIWDVIFQNLNQSFSSHVRAAPNSQFNEIAWHFPSMASANGENDSYVKLNTDTGEWDYGTLNRSAWIDQSVLGPPLGADPTGLIYQHETSADADGQAMDSWFETGDFMLSDGEDNCFIDYVIPDFKYSLVGQAQSAQVSVTIRAKKDASSSAPWVKGPYTVNAATQSFGTRIRGRFVSMRIESSDLGSFWRLGGVKFRYAQDGRN